MALIDSSARVIEDKWTYPETDGNAAIGAWFVFPLDVLAALGSATVIEHPIGTYVAAGVTADQIAPFLDKIDLVVVEFPKFRDGRGFTVARTLRERHGYKGDIRAIGHILPDQFAALVQCGFSSVVTPVDHPPEQWLQGNASAPNSLSGGPLLRRVIGRGAPWRQ